MGQTKVFVIIITYNGMRWYEKCFTTLRASTIPVTTIVVDNNSSDGTADYIRKEFPEVVVIESSENLGFGKGNNLAFQYALKHDCDYVFLLNQDTWLVDDNVIEELVRIHQENPAFGILSPMHLRGNEQELGMLWEDGNNLCSKMLVSDLFCNTLKDVYETNYVNAAAWLLPRKTLETVGGFDPIYQHYEEDDDYLNRVQFHGLKVGVCPGVRIVHDHQKKGINPFKKDSRYHREQRLLVKLLDLNTPLSIRHHYRYLFRKIFIYLLGGKVRAAKAYWQDFLFIRNNKKRILSHRETNANPGSHWIEK